MARRKPQLWTHIGHEPVTRVDALDNARFDGQVLTVIDPRREAHARYQVSGDLDQECHYWPNGGWVWL